MRWGVLLQVGCFVVLSLLFGWLLIRDWVLSVFLLWLLADGYVIAATFECVVIL